MGKNTLWEIRSRYPYILDLPSWQKFLLYVYCQDTFAVTISGDPNTESVFKILNVKLADYRFLTNLGNKNVFVVTIVNKENGFENKRYQLSPEGMKIAAQIIEHQDNLEGRKSQERIQTGMFIVSILVFFAAGLELIIKILNPEDKWVHIVVIIIFIIVSFWLIMKSYSQR